MRMKLTRKESEPSHISDVYASIPSPPEASVPRGSVLSRRSRNMMKRLVEQKEVEGLQTELFPWQQVRSASIDLFSQSRRGAKSRADPTRGQYVGCYKWSLPQVDWSIRGSRDSRKSGDRENTMSALEIGISRGIQDGTIFHGEGSCELL
jgi:hypothetical protein